MLEDVSSFTLRSTVAIKFVYHPVTCLFHIQAQLVAVCAPFALLQRPQALRRFSHHSINDELHRGDGTLQQQLRLQIPR